MWKRAARRSCGNWRSDKGIYFMEKIVFSDVDGTLLDHRHKITPLTLKAIRDLQAKGIPFVIVSARSPSGIYPILEEYGFTCPIIAYSGALILDEDRNVLFHKGMEKALAERIVGALEDSPFDVTWSVYALDEWIIKDKDDPRIIKEERIVKAQAVQGSVASTAADRISKILCICDPAETRGVEELLKKLFPACAIVPSADFLLEVMEGGVSKAAAVKRACGLWDIPLADAVAFGDYYNDADMLEAVGSGFLMGNAPAQLRERIHLLTDDNDHDGIYHALVRKKLVDK